MDTSKQRPRRKAEREKAVVPSAAQPPRSVDGLRELILRIGRDEADVSLGSKTHTVLAKLLERPEEVAVRTITDLAASLGINASTLTRLSTKLGYTGFADFQNVFRDSIAQRHRHFYSQQAERLVAGKKARQQGAQAGGTSPRSKRWPGSRKNPSATSSSIFRSCHQRTCVTPRACWPMRDAFAFTACGSSARWRALCATA